MHDKILQIIPAPADMWAIFRDKETGLVMDDRVVCLALIKGADGGTSVEAMVQNLGESIIFARDFTHFTGFHYGEEWGQR